MTRDEHIDRELERLFREWSLRAAPIGAAALLLLAPLSFLGAPELAERLLAFRLAAAGSLLLLWRGASRVRSPLALRALALTAVAIGAASIDPLHVFRGDPSAVFGDGVILLAVTVLGLVPAGAGFHLLSAAAIFGVSLAPLLHGRGAGAPPTLARDSLFVAILAVTILMRHLHRGTLKREIGLAFDIANRERQLEAQVAERTAALVNACREWRATFDSTDDLILLVDCEGHIVKSNLAAALFAAKPPDSLVGTPVTALLRRTGLDAGLAPLELAQRTAKRAAAEIRHEASGRWFLGSAEPIPQGRAQAGGVVLTLRDITDMKRMERAVTEARDDWQETFDSINEGITIHDADFVVLRANAAARRLLGRGEADLVGRRCFETFHGAAGPIGGCPGCETIRTARPTTVDLHEPHLGCHLEVTALPRAGGGIIHVVHDVSERKRAMDELSRAAERLQGILGHAPFGVFIVNEQFRVEFANPAMIAISGYPLEQFVGALLGGFPGCAELGMAPHVQAALEGVPFTIGPAEYHCRAGRRVIGQFTGIPFDEGGQRKAVVFVEDVTSLATAEQERHRLNALFLQAQKMESIGTLASGIAHDFNNILLAVIGLTDAAAEQLPADHMARPQLEAVIGSAERGSELVQQLLAFSRKQELRMYPSDLRLLVAEMRAMLVHVIPKNIAVAMDEIGAVPPVIADPAQIGQVLMNLAVNARDAMPDGGTLTMGAASVDVAESDPAHPGIPPGGYVLLTVRDTGTGMTPEVRERIFDPFFTTKGLGQGTGLGLATVYGIVSQHGGAVRVESEPGAGAAFFVYLPAVPGAQTAALLPVPRGVETILLVEDDALARQVIGRRLAEFGYRVLAAADGEEALRLVGSATAPPQLLLCDVVLPGISAREIAGIARARVPGLRVVFMSGHPESQLAQSGLLEPGDTLLSRSLGAEEIARRLRAVLDAAVLE
jgi:PAS domain S-box-containing protein